MQARLTDGSWLTIQPNQIDDVPDTIVELQIDYEDTAEGSVDWLFFVLSNLVPRTMARHVRGPATMQ